MTLRELKEAVQQLEPRELLDLRDFIEKRISVEEDVHPKVAALRHAIDLMREGLTEEDLDEIEWAMNVEYIEPLNTDDD